MRTTIRAILASLLAIPLAVSVATGPSVAAPPERNSYSNETMYADVYVHGQIAGLYGDIHRFQFDVDTTEPQFVGGMYSYDCPDGVTNPPQMECTTSGGTTLSSTDGEFKVSPRLNYATFIGTVDVQQFVNGYVTLVSGLPVDLRVTREGDVLTVKNTFEGTDDDGIRWLVSESSSEAAGSVTGTVNGIPVVQIENGQISILKSTARQLR